MLHLILSHHLKTEEEKRREEKRREDRRQKTEEKRTRCKKTEDNQVYSHKNVATRQENNAHNTYTNNVGNVSHISKAIDITSGRQRRNHVHAGKVTFKDLRADITTFECNVYTKAVAAIERSGKALRSRTRQ